MTNTRIPGTTTCEARELDNGVRGFRQCIAVTVGVVLTVLGLVNAKQIDALALTAPGCGEIHVAPFDSAAYEKATSVRCEVWDDVVEGRDCGEEAAAWLSKYLKMKVRLVVTAPDGAWSRPLDP